MRDLKKESNLSDRVKFNLLIQAGIMGSTVLDTFETIDVSKTGILIRAIDKELSFRRGTIIDIKIPLDKFIKGKNYSVEFLGKVVRIENEENNISKGKVIAGIQFIHFNKDGDTVWKNICDNLLKESESQNGPSYEDTFELIQGKKS